MGVSIASLKLTEEELKKIEEVLRLSKEGIVAFKLKAVKSGNYNAVLPLDNLEIQKGKEIVVAQLIPSKIYLLKVE